MGGSAEGPRNSGRLDTVQEEILKGTGTGYPGVMKNELVEKKANLNEQRDMIATQGKKESS